MKRIVILLALFLITSSNTWAGRAKVPSIARDPYVSALLINGETGQVLFSENPDTTVYPASVVKLMDLLVILDRVAQGQNSLDEMVQITPESAKTGGSQVYLDPKEQFSIDDLLYALMVQSANDAAVALATHIGGSKDGFVTFMNQKAAELGMKNTHFYSVHGLPPAEGQQTDETTANDLALLCRALVNRPEALKYTGTQERGFRNNSFIMRNHNKLLGRVVGCDGLKTGYFEAAGFSIAATAQKNGARVIAIVMGSKDRKVRDAKTAELLSKGFGLVPQKPVAAAAATIKKPASTVGVETPQVAQTAQTTAVVTTPEIEKPAPTTEGNSWKMFLLGLGAGVFVVAILAFFLLRQRSSPNKRW